MKCIAFGICRLMISSKRGALPLLLSLHLPFLFRIPYSLVLTPYHTFFRFFSNATKVCV